MPTAAFSSNSHFHDDLNTLIELYPTLDNFSFMRGKAVEAHTPEKVAEVLWSEFISQAGIDYD